jgi:hypothetical protein
MMGLLRMEFELGMWRTEGRRERSSLRRPWPFMTSFIARDGLLDRKRLGRETSTWLSDGQGVGDLEVGVPGADRAMVAAGQVSMETTYEFLTVIPPNIRGDG